MEALANDATSDFDFLGLSAKYDPVTNSFLDGGGVPVRQVTERLIPAFCHETNTFSESKFDIFSGIIDGVTGQPLHGTRIYGECVHYQLSIRYSLCIYKHKYIYILSVLFSHFIFA